MKTNIFNRIINNIAIGTFCLAAAGCNHDGEEVAPESEQGMMRLNFEVEAIATATRAEIPSTRGSIPAENGEETVNTLYLLMFDYVADDSGAYASTIELSEAFTMTQSYAIPLEENGLSTTGNYAILALANVDPASTDGDMNTNGLTDMLSSMTYKQAVQQANLFTSGAGTDQTDDSHTPTSSNLPMSATAVWMAGDDESVQITLKRSVVRFDITVM